MPSLRPAPARPLSPLRRPIKFYTFVPLHLARATAAELLFHLGNGLPAPLNVKSWRAAVVLNPHHVGASLARADVLLTRQDPQAWAAFQAALAAIRNPQHTSASDLALTTVPGALFARVAQFVSPRVRQAPPYLQWHSSLQNLAHRHWERASAQKDAARAAEAWAVWRSTGAGTTPPAVTLSEADLALRWAGIEQAWMNAQYEGAQQAAAPLIERGEFVSPPESIVWAERFLEANASALAGRCYQWAQEWIPERAEVWAVGARLAQADGNLTRAAALWERAQNLDPENTSYFLAHQNLDRGTPLHESKTVTLKVKAPALLEVGATAMVECVLGNAANPCTIHLLPPAGWGLCTTSRAERVTDGGCTFTVTACRPDRVRGEPWTLTVVALCGDEYAVTRIQIAVPDRTPGRLWVLATEDHELWEERGVITRTEVESLLVAKSQFAAEQFAPWTHMVEVGSALGLLDWTAAQDAGWRSTRDAVYNHLVAQVAAGNDLQPHLHAFNLPESPDFPYRLTADGLAPTDEFLLTPEDKRKDFARAYPPQARMQAVADAVVRVQRMAATGDSTYRAVMWRSGQLEFGDTAAARAWSAVALLRAGLWGDSDLRDETRPAFFVAIQDPFKAKMGGELLQLPLWGNLEGNFFRDARALVRRVQQTIAPLREETGTLKPGLHVFTLITHDKFINARRGGDEFCLDADYNEWATIRTHLEAWRAEGAVQVTAREAVPALLDDASWQLRGWLVPAGEPDAVLDVLARHRYTLRLLGAGIPVSEKTPQAVLVTLPPGLIPRPEVWRVCQGEAVLETEPCGERAFWVTVTRREPEIECWL